ncbi:MAG: tail protein X [Planctomycetes bacterium]|nr:tail protein X [Planctomycetota bacterium]
MGKLEKAGIIVVGCLILVIVIVGAINRGGSSPQDEESTPRDDQRAAMERQEDKGDRSRLSGGRGERTLEDIRREMETPKTERPSEAGRSLVNPEVVPVPGPSERPGGRPLLEEPPVVPASADGWPKTHQVVANDLLENLCDKYYGRAGLVAHVLAANPGLDPRRMRPGKTVITFPAPPAARERPATAKRETEDLSGAELTSLRTRRPSFISASYLRRNAQRVQSGGSSEGSSGAPLAGGKTHTVAKDDVLGTIAQKHYGSSAPKYVDAIVKANAGLIKNPNSLREGWVLTIPDVN